MKVETYVSEIKVTYSPGDLTKRPKIRHSIDAYNIFRASWDPGLIQYIEQFKILLLSKGNNVIGLLHISTGGVSSTVVDPKLIFGAALSVNASGFVLCHNHPSGSLSPSKEDIKCTVKIVAGAKLFDMVVFDHLIINHLSYFSMMEKELL